MENQRNGSCIHILSLADASPKGGSLHTFVQATKEEAMLTPMSRFLLKMETDVSLQGNTFTMRQAAVTDLWV